MSDQIQRLGFAHWADNIIANFIEDHPEMTSGNYGSITVERSDGTAIRAVYGVGMVSFLVRGYTPGGWEIHERTLKTKGGLS